MGSEQESGLVAIDSISARPLISHAQKETLVRIGLRYLQEKRIPINLNTVQGIGEVVLDALGRGLAQTGKTHLEEKESVSKFVKVGFEIRERIKDTARKTVDQSQVSAVNTNYLGPLAVPRSMVKSAKRELVNFDMNPKINTCEQLIQLTNQRQIDLDTKVELVILQLPEELQINVRKRNLTTDEKAKLIRNLITAVVFRKDKNPIISIDELWEFNQSYKINRHIFFTSDDFERISEFGKYVADLFEQTKETFSSASLLSYESKDQLFRTFGANLLLLHPALEEEQIIIDPEKYDSGTSLWDSGFAVEIEGFLVPKREIIQAAIRQKEAGLSLAIEQYKITADNLLSEPTRKLLRGLESWRILAHDKVRTARRKPELATKIKSQTELIPRLREKMELIHDPDSRSVVKRKINTLQVEISQLSSRIKMYEYYTKSAGSIRKVVSRFYKQARQEPRKAKYLEVPIEIYQELLNNRIIALGATIYRLGVIFSKEKGEKREEIAQKLAEAEQKQTDLSSEREKIHADGRTKTLSDLGLNLAWVTKLYQEATLGSLPIGINKPKLRSEAERSMEMHDVFFLSKFLPGKVSQRSFSKAIDKAIPILEKSLERKKSNLDNHTAVYGTKESDPTYVNIRGEVRLAEDCIKSARIFKELIASRVLALKSSNGMSKRRYLEVLASRRLLIRQYFQVPRIAAKLNEKLQIMAILKRELMLREAMDTLKTMEDELSALETTDSPKSKHLRRMQSLGLAIPAEIKS